MSDEVSQSHPAVFENIRLSWRWLRWKIWITGCDRQVLQRGEAFFIFFDTSKSSCQQKDHINPTSQAWDLYRPTRDRIIFGTWNAMKVWLHAYIISVWYMRLYKYIYMHLLQLVLLIVCRPLTGHPAVCLACSGDLLDTDSPPWWNRSGKQLSHVVCCEMSPKMIRHHETWQRNDELKIAEAKSDKLISLLVVSDSLTYRTHF